MSDQPLCNIRFLGHTRPKKAKHSQEGIAYPTKWRRSLRQSLLQNRPGHCSNRPVEKIVLPKSTFSSPTRSVLDNVPIHPGQERYRGSRPPGGMRHKLRRDSSRSNVSLTDTFRDPLSKSPLGNRFPPRDATITQEELFRISPNRSSMVSVNAQTTDWT